MSEPTPAPIAEPVAQDVKKDAPLDENGQPLSKGEIKRREKEAASECLGVPVRRVRGADALL